MAVLDQKSKGCFGRLLKVSGLLALVFIIGVAGAWFFMRDGLIAKMIDLVESRLAKSGLYIERDSHELTWNRGVVLKGLRLFTDEEKQERVAYFENVGVRIPIWEILNDDPRLVLSSKRGDLKIGTSEGPLILEKLDFELVFSDGVLVIDYLEGSVNGLRLTTEGDLHWVSGGKARKIEIPDFAPLVRACKWIDFPKGGATLAMTVHSRDSQGVDLNAVFSGKNFQWKDLTIDRARVPIALGEEVVEMASVSIDCYGGNVSGDLVVDYKKGEIRVSKVVSSAEPFRLIGAIIGGGALEGFGSKGKTVMRGKDIIFDLKKFAETRGFFQVDSPGGLMVPLGGKKMLLEKFNGEVRFESEGLVVDGRKFLVFEGASKGRYQMPLSGGFRYQLNAHPEHSPARCHNAT